MNTQLMSDAAAYTEAVQREREIWQALQACAPGSEARERAWTEWTEAISRTNEAWRKLSASRIAQPWRQSPAVRPGQSRANA
jgi:hypothetical protein